MQSPGCAREVPSLKSAMDRSRKVPLGPFALSSRRINASPASIRHFTSTTFVSFIHQRVESCRVCHLDFLELSASKNLPRLFTQMSRRVAHPLRSEALALPTLCGIDIGRPFLAGGCLSGLSSPFEYTRYSWGIGTDWTLPHCGGARRR